MTRGTRVLTYAMEGEAGSGVVCVNGAAAHLAKPGDIVIIATFTQLDDESARTAPAAHRPHGAEQRHHAAPTSPRSPAPNAAPHWSTS